MSTNEERAEHLIAIDHLIRQLIWQSQKQLLQTLSRPDIGLTLPQMITLFAIRGAGTCRMSELAEITQQSAGTLTGIVDRLIEDRLVGRVRDVDDRRVVQVTLTPQGEAHLERLEQARREDMERMLRSFSDEQIILLESLLSQLLKGINELLSASTATHGASKGNGSLKANGSKRQPSDLYPPLHHA